jgi:membrane protease YdiL (CAAX protease family)
MQSRSLAAGKQHHGNVTHYLSVIVAEWALSFYVWLGGLIPGATRLRDLVGGRWSSWKDVLRDIGIGAAFWVVFAAAGIFMNFLLGPSHVETLGFVNPRGAVEVTLWVMMSMTAGFCEELIFRGYLQKQFLALTGSAALAVLAQAVLFGVCHWYQGSKLVITIMVLGLLYGILAHWRKSLRPGMISHAWSDILNVIPMRFP